MTVRCLNLGSVTKAWKHFVPPSKQIVCTVAEAFWDLHGTERHSSVLRQAWKSWEVLAVYYTFMWWGSVWNSSKTNSIPPVPSSSCHYPVLVPVSEIRLFGGFSVSTTHKNSHHVPTSPSDLLFNFILNNRRHDQIHHHLSLPVTTELMNKKTTTYLAGKGY